MRGTFNVALIAGLLAVVSATPSVAQPEPVATKATASGIRVSGEATLEVQVKATAATKEAAEAAAKLEAAKTAMQYKVVNTAFAHADWAAQAAAATTIETRGRKEWRSGDSYIGEYIVTVNEAALLKWAAGAGLRWTAIVAGDREPVLLLVAANAAPTNEQAEDLMQVNSALSMYFIQHEVQLTDAETYFEMYGLSPTNPEAQKLGDLRVHYSVRVEKGSTAGTIRAAVRVKGINPSAVLVLFDAERYSGEVVESQRAAAIQLAAQDAAHVAYVGLLRNGHEESELGPWFNFRFTGATDNDVRDAVEAALKAVAKDAASVRVEWRKPDLMATIRVKVELVEPLKMYRAFQAALNETDYRLTDHEMRGRRLKGELAKK